MSDTKIAVGIIDDHKLFRRGIEDIINDSGKYTLALSVEDSASLYYALKSISIEILLLDINLKGENGLDILVSLAESHPNIKCIMLTMHNEGLYINTMVKKGAKGYLTKDITPEILMETLDQVHTKGLYFDSHVTNVIVESIQAGEHLKSLGVVLTQLEQDVLKLISDGLTSDEIGAKVFKSSRTIEGYRKKLLEKTGSKNIAELVSWGYKNKVL